MDPFIRLNCSSSTAAGLRISIMVADAGAAIDAVTSAGGEVVQPIHPDRKGVFATFSDPAGNVIGIYQQPGLAEARAR